MLSFADHLVTAQGRFFADPELTPTDKLVFIAISTLTANAALGACTASNRSLGEAIGVHPDTVRRSIYKLIELKYLERVESEGQRFVRSSTGKLFFSEEGGCDQRSQGVIKDHRVCDQRSHTPPVIKDHTKQSITEVDLNKNIKANARAREDFHSKAIPQNPEEPLVDLTEYQVEQVKLSYIREIPREKLEWAIQRGVELLEAWLVKRDPNTNRMNYENVQKAHHDRLMKGWVLREVQKEISSKNGNSGPHKRNGGGKLTVAEKLEALWRNTAENERRFGSSDTFE